MCGIVGCFAKERCYERLFGALLRLEYRGYDSAGIAVLRREEGCGGRISLRKRKGGVARLAGERLEGDVGIGHTRWATHGRPSDVNAHPHCSGKFALVHNGIVENCAALREELAKEGVRFVSETDSEVIVRLIDRAYRGNFFAAVCEACARVEGAFAIAVLCEDFPGELICARRGSPLIAAAGGGALYVCSDIPALDDADFICPMQDGEFVRIRDGAMWFLDGEGNVIPKTFTRPPVCARLRERSAKSCMEEEIFEIPRALSDTLAGMRETDFAPAARVLRAAKRVFAVACGTAYHAALLFKDALERDARIPVLCQPASEFRCRDPLAGEGDVVVAVSQSGETADTLAAARLARGRGAFVVCVTNVACSTLARESDFVLAMCAGPEIAVAATKSYNCQILCLYYLAAMVCFYKFCDFPAWFSALDSLPAATAQTFSLFPQMHSLANSLRGVRALYFIGRGEDVRTAREGALKVKEIAYVFAEGYAAGELKHGTLALIEEGFPVFALSTKAELLKKTESALEEVRSRGGLTVLFSQYAEALESSCADVCVRLPEADERLMPLLSVIPLQYFACSMCLLRGYDPDRPRNLAKSVTVE